MRSGLRRSRAKVSPKIRAKVTVTFSWGQCVVADAGLGSDPDCGYVRQRKLGLWVRVVSRVRARIKASVKASVKAGVRASVKAGVRVKVSYSVRGSVRPRFEP